MCSLWEGWRVKLVISSWPRIMLRNIEQSQGCPCCLRLRHASLPLHHLVPPSRGNSSCERASGRDRESERETRQDGFCFMSVASFAINNDKINKKRCKCRWETNNIAGNSLCVCVCGRGEEGGVASCVASFYATMYIRINRKYYLYNTFNIAHFTNITLQSLL